MVFNDGTGAPGLRNPNRAGTPSPFIGWGGRIGMKDYKSQYLHPKWQKRRLEILEAAGYQCQTCDDTEKTLHVHHKRYIKGRDVWDYADDDLEVLCADCHKHEHWQRDELNKMVSTMCSEQVADLLCIIAGMKSYALEIADDELNNWRSLNSNAVEVGYIVGSLTSDRCCSEAAMLADVLRANPPDYPLYADCYPPNETPSYLIGFLQHMQAMED